MVPAMSELAKGCEHFLEYRQNHGLQSFKIIYKYLVKPGQEARKLKVYTGRLVFIAVCSGRGTRPNLGVCGAAVCGRNVFLFVVGGVAKRSLARSIVISWSHAFSLHLSLSLSLSFSLSLSVYRRRRVCVTCVIASRRDSTLASCASTLAA